MISEDLQVTISAKITDFDKKMATVSKKLDTLQKNGTVAGKSVDKVLAAKGTGTHKSLDLVKQKLSQVTNKMESVRKSFAKKLPMDASSIETQKIKLDQLKQKYADLTTGNKAPTSLKAMEREFTTLEKQVAKTDAQLAKMYADIQGLTVKKSMASNLGDASGAAGYQAQIDTVKSQMDSMAASTDGAAARMTALTSRMQQVRLNPASSDEARALAAKISQADAKMQKLGADSNKTSSKISGIKTGSKALDSIDKKLKKIESSSSRTAKAVNRLGKMFLLMLARTLIRGAMQGLSESFEGAATKSEKLKSSLDSLTTAGRTISNAVVTALAPLINAASPMIDTISAKIMDLGNNIAMFFAFVTGQSTVMQATKTYQAYGTAATAAADAANAANNSIAGFDQITKLDTTKASGSGSGSTAADNGTTSFTEVPVVGSDNAQKIKGAIDKIKGPLQDFYNDVLKPLGNWAMTDGIDGLVNGMSSVAQFFKDNPQCIDNLAFFLLTLGGLSALGPTALVIGVTIQAEIMAIEWVTGKDLGKAVSDSFNVEVWKNAGFTSVISGWSSWIKNTIMDGLIGTNTFADDSVADQYIEWLFNTFDVSAGYGYVMLNEIGVNIAEGIANAFVDAWNFYFDGWFNLINNKLGEVGLDPLSFDFHIDPVESTDFYDDMKKQQQAKKDAMDQTSKWATMEQKGAAQIAQANADSAKSTKVSTASVVLSTKQAGNDLTASTSQTAGAITSNAGTSTAQVVASYNNMNPALQAAMGSYYNTVSTNSGNARATLIDESAAGASGSTGQFIAMSNNAATIFTAMAENARHALYNIARNLTLLPSNASRQSAQTSMSLLQYRNMQNLTLFAEGGVVNGPTNALIGEAGKEAVVPLERNTGWIDKLAEKINGKSGGGDIYVTVENIVDGKVIEKKVTKIQQNNARRNNRPVWGNA